MAKHAEVSDLKKHIGFWMRLVSNSVSFGFARSLESSGVTVAEWVVLREMYDCKELVAPSHVAQLTGLSRGAVSKLIDRLLGKELVVRTESTQDRRYQEIKLTKQAQLLVPKLAQLADKNDEHFFSGLTQSERNALTGLLKKVAHTNKITKMPVD